MPEIYVGKIIHSKDHIEYGLFYDDENGKRQWAQQNALSMRYIFSTEERAQKTLDHIREELKHETENPFSTEEAERYVNKQKWYEASGYAETEPRSYLNKWNIDQKDDPEYERFVAYMLMNGRKRGKKQTYIVLGDYLYWFVRNIDGLAIDWINRTELSNLDVTDDGFKYNKEKVLDNNKRKLEEAKKSTGDYIEFEYDEFGHTVAMQNGEFAGYIIDTGSLIQHADSVMQPGAYVQHFKRLTDNFGNNHLYKVIGKAVNSDNGQDMMVYQALFGDKKIYVRPLLEYLSEVDRKKFPEVRQRFIFETYRGDIKNLTYDLLTVYISRLAQESYGHYEKDEDAGDDTYHLPYIVYDDVIKEIEKAVYAFDLSHPGYRLDLYKSTMGALGMKTVFDPIDPSELYGKEVMAIIFCAFRIERFFEGTLLSFCNSGLMKKYLERLKEIDEEGDHVLSREVIPRLEYFKFNIGGFRGGYDHWIIVYGNDGYNIYKDYMEKIGEPKHKEIKSVNLDKWLLRLSDIKLNNWRRCYDDDHVLDGTQWTLVYKFDNLSIEKKYGNNQYPENYIEFKQLISELDLLLEDCPEMEYDSKQAIELAHTDEIEMDKEKRERLRMMRKNSYHNIDLLEIKTYAESLLKYAEANDPNPLPQCFEYVRDIVINANKGVSRLRHASTYDNFQLAEIIRNDWKKAMDSEVGLPVYYMRISDTPARRKANKEMADMIEMVDNLISNPHGIR
ncbi:Protein of unknown function [Ruminococcaceae bacterium KH2T8]|nr:Protein of unknown function [Ruminococcaceae bacterium KH2T8]